MVANRAVKLASAILILTGAFFGTSTAAFAEDSGVVVTAASHNSKNSEDPTPSPTSTEQSESAKQAAEKAREAAKQAAEKTREAAKQAAEKVREAAKKAKSSKSDGKSGQLQLPPLIIRPAEPGDKVSADTEDDSNSTGSNNGDSNATPTASPAASSDPNAITTGAGTGSKKFYKKPATTQNTQVSSTDQSGSGQDASTQADGSTNNSAEAGGSPVAYVVAPIGDGSSATLTAQESNFLKSADPTANDPIRIVSAATSKTPADQFFEAAGYGIAALGGGVALLMGWGVYRGIRARRSEGFDFEYRS